MLRNIASENSVVHLEENNTKKSDGLVGGIELELGMDVDSEGRDHGREQTSQRAGACTRCKTYNDQDNIQVIAPILHKICLAIFRLITVALATLGMIIPRD